MNKQAIYLITFGMFAFLAVSIVSAQDINPIGINLIGVNINGPQDNSAVDADFVEITASAYSTSPFFDSTFSKGMTFAITPKQGVGKVVLNPECHSYRHGAGYKLYCSENVDLSEYSGQNVHITATVKNINGKTISDSVDVSVMEKEMDFSWVVVNIESPINNEKVFGTIDLIAKATSSNQFKTSEEYVLGSPISFTIKGDNTGELVLNPTCQESKVREIYHAVCTYSWNSFDYEGDNVRITAQSTNVKDTTSEHTIKVRVRDIEQINVDIKPKSTLLKRIGAVSIYKLIKLNLN